MLFIFQPTQANYLHLKDGLTVVLPTELERSKLSCGKSSNFMKKKFSNR